MIVSTLINILFLSLILFLSGCQLPYLVSGAFEQVKILSSRQKITKAFQSVALTNETKDKLRFSLKARDFALANGLTCKNNFKTYVKLNRPYVSYLVVASKKNKIDPKKWWFPIFGSFPYKGYFFKKQAESAALKLQAQGYDTYVRGVTAYSSLGWFKEPILSSMLRYNKYSIAETIFHECFHTTFFIKNNTQVNERSAVFFAHHFMIKFLKDLNNIKQKEKKLLSWEESKKFTSFLQETIIDAIKYYDSNTHRKVLFKSIEKNYLKDLKPKITINNYDHIFLKGLNNAKLAAFKTYFHKFNKLEDNLKNKFSNDIFIYLAKIKSLKTKKEKLSFL